MHGDSKPERGTTVKAILWCCVAVLAVYIIYRATIPDGRPASNWRDRTPSPQNHSNPSPSLPASRPAQQAPGLQALVDFLNANSPNNATYRVEYNVANVFGDRGAALFVNFKDHPDAMRQVKQAARTAPGTFCQMVRSIYERCDGNVCLDDVVSDAGVVLVGVEGVSKTCTF